jgi:hypothetical protein
MISCIAHHRSMITDSQGLFNFERKRNLFRKLRPKTVMSVSLLELENINIRFGGLIGGQRGELARGRGRAGWINRSGMVLARPPSQHDHWKPIDGRKITRRKSHRQQLPCTLPARMAQPEYLAFGSMSVFDNVRAATQLHRAHGICHALWRGRSHQDSEREVEIRVMD